MGKEKVIYAKDMKCCECGRQAVALFPCCDPDIPAYPYCRECLDKAKYELIIKLTEIDEKYGQERISKI